jgi:hypothetical protein
MIDGPAPIISVLDFRRRRMSVRWNIATGSWTAHEESPKLVYGIALIRPVQPHLCLYGHEGRLILQIAKDQYALNEESLRITSEREWRTLGFGRRFKVEASPFNILFAHRYWSNSGPDFFKFLAEKAQDPNWRSESAREWSNGIDSAKLRETWL